MYAYMYTYIYIYMFIVVTHPAEASSSVDHGNRSVVHGQIALTASWLYS